MTERIRTLLDVAVEGVRPRAGDPVSEITRRGRAARRRYHVLAGTAVAVLLLAGGLVAVGGRPGGEAPPGTTGTAAPDRRRPAPPKVPPQVVDGEVRVGGLTMPVPAGWRVVRDTSLLYCQIPDRSVLVNVSVSPGGDCNQVRTHVQFLDWLPNVSPRVIHDPPVKMPGRGLNEVVLPGGTPVWFDDNNLRNVQLSKGERGAYLSFELPWVQTGIYFEVPSADFTRIVRSIRVQPVEPARLSLPDQSTGLVLQISGAEVSHTRDKKVTDEVIKRLAALDRVVEPGGLPCAGAPPLVGEWQLAGGKMARLSLLAADGTSPATIVLSTSDDCAFATSSLGGRVWLPPAFVTELSRLVPPAGQAQHPLPGSPAPEGAPND